MLPIQLGSPCCPRVRAVDESVLSTSPCCQRVRAVRESVLSTSPCRQRVRTLLSRGLWLRRWTIVSKTAESISQGVFPCPPIVSWGWLKGMEFELVVEKTYCGDLR